MGYGMTWRVALVVAVLCVPASPAITWTTAASITTIAVNVLEIKSNVQKARAAAKAVKKASIKAGKKMKSVVGAK